MRLFLRLVLDVLRALFAPGRRLPLPSRRGRRDAGGGPTSSRSGDERLQIDYSPNLDGDADPGEIVWTWVPFEDEPSRGKDRPVLVVGRRAGRLVGVALTSKPGERGDRLSVGTGPWDREGRPSYAKLDRLIDLSQGRIRREGAVLDRARFETVARSLECR
jgi:PemK-like, MazF-like toxin of type II toxin-antitoxin system